MLFSVCQRRICFPLDLTSYKKIKNINPPFSPKLGRNLFNIEEQLTILK